MPLHKPKAEWRQEFFRRRREFAAQPWLTKRAEKKLRQNLWRALGKTLSNTQYRILAYRPMPSEPRLDRLLQGANCEIFYPQVLGRQLLARQSGKQLCLTLCRMDLIIVPCLLFRHDGIRLGRGGGYYDRALKFIARNKTLIIAYHWQLEEKIPAEDHDIPVGCWLTDLELHPPGLRK